MRLMSPVSFNSMSLSAPRVQTLSNNALVGKLQPWRLRACDSGCKPRARSGQYATQYIGTAFGHYSDGLIHYYSYWQDLTSEQTPGLEFHTFYHPFSSEYVTSLNQGGVAALLESDTRYRIRQRHRRSKVITIPNFSRNSYKAV